MMPKVAESQHDPVYPTCIFAKENDKEDFLGWHGIFVFCSCTGKLSQYFMSPNPCPVGWATPTASCNAALSSSGPMRAALIPWASHQRPSALTQEPRRQTRGFSQVAHISWEKFVSCLLLFFGKKSFERTHKTLVKLEKRLIEVHW